MMEGNTNGKLTRQVAGIKEKLSTLSEQCEACHQFLRVLPEEPDTEAGEKALAVVLKEIRSHLFKKHHIVPQGFYLGFGLSIGLCLGAALGLLSDNIGWGIPAGMLFGAAIGAGLDADARRKGRSF